MYNQPSNFLRNSLLSLGILLYRLGLASVILKLSRNRVRALLYHAVEVQESPYTQRLGVSVSPAMFDENLAYFAKHYNVINVNQLTSKDLPDNPLVITFDDGYKSVYDNAFPLLKKHHLPACVYLISRAVENRLVWVNAFNWALIEHRNEALEICEEFPDLRGVSSRGQLISIVQNRFSPSSIELLCNRLAETIDFDENHGLYASSEDIAEMSRRNIVFGFHTRDHFNLSNCNLNELAEQMDSQSVSKLLNNETFAYPFGSFNQEAVQVVSNAGYQRIMTVGNNNDRYCPKHMDRVEVFAADPAVVFAKLEIVEPIIATLRRWWMNCRQTQQRIAEFRAPSA